MPPKLVPRPALDIPNDVTVDALLASSQVRAEFHDELRWPLTAMNHPALEPKFPIAQEFAKPGVGWLELCKSCVQSRYGGDKELLSYLRGWCKAIDGDVSAACADLVPLLRSTKSRLAAAVRNDLANILAQGHADDAEHYIRVHSIRDVGMLDLLAANYVEVGTNDDALAINLAAIDSDDYATNATKCIRWTKHIILSDDKQSALIRQVESLADTRASKAPDATCVSEAQKLRCWARGQCTVYGTAQRSATLASAYRAWSSATTTSDWLNIADTAMTASPEPGFAELTIAAMQNAVSVDLWSSDECSARTVTTVQHYGELLKQMAFISAEMKANGSTYAAKIDSLVPAQADQLEETCRTHR